MRISIYRGRNSQADIEVEGGLFDSPEKVAETYLKIKKVLAGEPIRKRQPKAVPNVSAIKEVK